MKDRRKASAFLLPAFGLPAGAAFIIVISLSVFYVFIDPRPYFIAASDGDHDYYYNAQLILDTGFPGMAWHPGTPGYYLAALAGAFGRVFDTGPQLLLNFGYLSVAIVAAISFWYFFYVLRRVVSNVALWISLAILLSWPSVIFFLNSFVSDLFAISLTVAGIGAFWKYWIIESNPTPRRIILLAVLFGVAMSFKLTVVPVIAVTWFVAIVGILRSSRKKTGSSNDGFDSDSKYRRMTPLRTALLGPAITIGTFALFTAPVWGMLHLAIRTLPGRLTAHGWLGPASGSPAQFVAWYANHTPVVGVSIICAMIILIVGIATRRVARRAPEISGQANPDLFLGGLYAVMLLGIFTWGIVTLVG